MRKPISAVLVKTAALLTLAAAVAAAPAAGQPASPSPEPVEDPPDLWFPVGEDLVYKVYWGFIPIGKSRIVTRWVRERDDWLLAIRVRTRSNRFIATVYPVDDVIETVVDPDPFLPIVFTKNLREGDHRYHEITTFDYADGQAHWMSVTKQESRSYPITDEVRDLLSFLYFLRSQDLSKAVDQEYRVVADEKIYSVSTRSHGKDGKKVGHFGKVPCLELEPRAEFQGLFAHEGRVRLWVSLRDRPLITAIKAKTTLGSIHAVLHLVKGPGDDFWTRATQDYLDKHGTDDEDDPEVNEAMQELDAPMPNETAR